MNNCHKVISALTNEQRNVLLSSRLISSERKLLTLYARSRKPLSLERVASKLDVHPVHISRLNSALFTKIFDELAISGSQKELDVLYNAGLYQQLFNEITKRISLIPLISDMNERIKHFHSYLAFVIEMPYSRNVDLFLQYVVKKMIDMVPNLPIGHKEAIELTAIWVRIAFKPIYTQKSRKYITNQEKDIINVLDKYASRIELSQNPFFLEKLYKAYTAYYNNIALDIEKANAAITNALEANKHLETYPFLFDTKSTLGMMRRRINYFFHLSKFEEIITTVDLWSQSQKKEFCFTPSARHMMPIFVAYISLHRYADAKELCLWYRTQLEELDTPTIQQQLYLNHMESVLHVHLEEYEKALEVINEISNSNKHPNYSLGIESINRILECECYLLLQQWEIADQTIRRNIKWYERNSDSYMQQNLLVLRGFLQGLNYMQTGALRSKSHWMKMMNKLKNEQLFGSEVSINRISNIFGFSKDIAI